MVSVMYAVGKEEKHPDQNIFIRQKMLTISRHG